jgi:hypothetical protein
MHLRPRLRRGALAGALLLAGIATGPLAVGTASAHTAVCRSDPMFYMSNGYKLDVTADIGTRQSDVRMVTYNVHVPIGVTISHAVYTGGPFVNKERVAVFADNPAGAYDTDTVVTTQTPGVSVTAHTYVLSQLDNYDYKATGTAIGNSGVHLKIHLNG